MGVDGKGRVLITTTPSRETGMAKVGNYSFDEGGSEVGTITFHVRSITHMLMHNGRLADPMDEYSKKIKEITSKRKKTDEDFAEIADLEWQGSLYTDGKKVIVTRKSLIGAYVEAGRKLRRGTDVRAALWSERDWILVHPGAHRPLEDLMRDRAFRDMGRVGVNGSTVMRCRPRFDPWELKYDIKYFRSIFNARDICQITDVLGRYVGLSDDRVVLGGRFRIENVIDHDAPK
jgi:hypothetical protein